MAEVDLNQAGIYKILNSINGNFYLGSAVNFRKRWELHKHQLKNNKHDNRHLQAAWKLYGEDAFEFIILEVCDKEILLEKEQLFIDWLKPNYNICKSVAQSRLGIKSTPEHIAKIVAANKGVPKSDAQKAKLRIARLGSKLTEEQKQARRDYRHTDEDRAKIVAAQIGRTHSEEAKNKMSLARKATALRKDQEFFANVVVVS